MAKKNIKINLLGFKCPLPVLKANHLIKQYSNGDIIEIAVDDKAAPEDFKVYCDTKHYELISIEEDEYIKIKIKI